MTPEMRGRWRQGARSSRPSSSLTGRSSSWARLRAKARSQQAGLRGHAVQIWPARFPNGKQRRIYGDKLAAYITYTLDRNPSLVGTSTEPKRFSEEDLAKREIAWGRAGFALQYMLDTSLADVG